MLANYSGHQHMRNAGRDPRTGAKRNEKNDMKNRNWFCYSLDMLGLTLLASAALALLAAVWFGGAALEVTLLAAFRAALMGAVASFLTARSVEIVRLVLHEKHAPAKVVETYVSDNVEQLPERRNLPRAA